MILTPLQTFRFQDKLTILYRFIFAWNIVQYVLQGYPYPPPPLLKTYDRSLLLWLIRPWTRQILKKSSWSDVPTSLVSQRPPEKGLLGKGPVSWYYIWSHAEYTFVIYTGYVSKYDSLRRQTWVVPAIAGDKPFSMPLLVSLDIDED